MNYRVVIEAPGNTEAYIDITGDYYETESGELTIHSSVLGPVATFPKYGWKHIRTFK